MWTTGYPTICWEILTQPQQLLSLSWNEWCIALRSHHSCCVDSRGEILWNPRWLLPLDWLIHSFCNEKTQDDCYTNDIRARSQNHESGYNNCWWTCELENYLLMTRDANLTSSSNSSCFQTFRPSWTMWLTTSLSLHCGAVADPHSSVSGSCACR